MKKRGLAFQQVVWALIVLITILGASKAAFDMAKKPANYLFGFANITAFDKDLIERFNLTSEYNAEAVDSVNGLLYAINSLAFVDTYGLENTKIADETVSSEVEREYNNVNIKPTYFDRETISIPVDLSYDDLVTELAIGTISCWHIHDDSNFENTRCYSIKFSENYPIEILQNVDALSEDGFLDFMNDNKESICQRLITRRSEFRAGSQELELDECKRNIVELTGDGLFNINSIEWDELDNKYFQNHLGSEVRICANNAGINEIWFHSPERNNFCKVENKNGMGFGYRINNFALPQEIDDKNLLVYSVEDWLFAYGDPEYILFYEKFPQEEAQYWEMSNFQIAWGTIFLVEGAFLGIDAITFGMGRVLRPLKEPIQGLAKKLITPFKKAARRTAAITGRTLKGIFSKPFEWTAKKAILGETLEKEAKTVIEKSISGILGSVDNELADGLTSSMKTTLDDFLKVGADNRAFIDSAGGITKEGGEEFVNRLQKEVFTTDNKAYNDLIVARARQLQGELADSPRFYADALTQTKKEFTQTALGAISDKLVLASFKAVPRVAVFTARSIGRGRNLLKEVLLGDMTESARKEAVIKLLRGGEDAFTRMKPIHQRTLLSNTKVARETLFDEKSGKIILGEIGEEFTEESSQLAARNLDNILNSETAESLFPKSALVIQGFASSTFQQTGSVLSKKRHLVAAMAVIMAYRIESMAAKNYPVGTNAIGLKAPFEYTIPFKEFEMNVNSVDINDFIYNKADQVTQEKVEDHKALAEQVLENFGETGFQGMLPEANRYYLSLVKDRGLFDQDDQRLHLVSPCETDILIEVTTCECYYRADVESGVYLTGAPQEIYAEDENGDFVMTGQITNIPNFDGTNAMLYTLDNNGDAVKECHAAKVFQFDDLHTPKCIKVNPLIENFDGNNYCYHGINSYDKFWKGYVTYLQVGLPFLGIFCGPVAPACMAGIGLITGLGGETIKGNIDIASQWPGHD